MSVEALVLTELVRDGSPKKMLKAGIMPEDFELYDEEIEWVMQQHDRRKPITIRRFKKQFPDFEIVQTTEKIGDLLEELKAERAFVAISSAIDEISTNLDHENAIEKAFELKEILQGVIHTHGQITDVMLKGDWEHHFKEMKRVHLMREAGMTPGIPTGLANLDYHLGGWRGGRLHLVLGRPGDAKSYFIAKACVEAMLDGRRVGLFSPEMDEMEHQCRISTLVSANKLVQEACGLTKSFRNRALMDGDGFDLKAYRRFLKWMNKEIEGEIVLFNKKHRREKMSVGYIESRMQELGLDMIVVDPLYKLRPPKKRQLKHEDLGDITDQLQDVGHAYGVPVIVTNQAHRQGGSRDKAPDKDTSFGSDAPVQEATFVMGVKFFEDEQVMQIRCTKSRFGPAFHFDVKMNPNTGYMKDLTEIKIHNVEYDLEE